MEEEQYWADASTKNCVWCFQIKMESYGSEGCTCGLCDYEDTYDHCDCAVEYWLTQRIFLTKEEAKRFGESKPYEYGDYLEGWRVYGLPCDGIMAKLLGQHRKEFKDKVQHIRD